MMVALVLIGILALLGHLMFWVGVFNRVHATAIHHKVIKAFEKVVFLLVLLVPLSIGWLVLKTDRSPTAIWELISQNPAIAIYLTLSCGVLIVGLPTWLTHWLAPVPNNLRSCETRVVSVRNAAGERPIGDRTGRLFSLIPGNEIFDLHVHVKTLTVPRLSERLAGLSIAHLSDLHFTGHIDRYFFDRIVDEVRQAQPDLTVITGDIIDKVRCFDWLRPTLGRLTAKHGVFFILGNHDKRLPDVSKLRQELVDAGLIDLGGKAMSITIRDEAVFLAGNELPWFQPAPNMADYEATKTNFGLRLLLSHSPDQFNWAQQHGFDVVLAGHTHGGQIRLPLVGPIVAPSRFGVRYASGLFVEGNTIMHVSRGLSGLDPVRINCPPELTQIVLEPGKV